jgi:hypothetical protein
LNASFEGGSNEGGSGPHARRLTDVRGDAHRDRSIEKASILRSPCNGEPAHFEGQWGCQTTYLEEQCGELLAHLDAAIEATRLASPVRSQRQPFNPDGSQRNRRAADRINALNEERLLEAKCAGANRDAGSAPP